MPTELTSLLIDAGFTDVAMCAALKAHACDMDARHGGSIIDGQIMWRWPARGHRAPDVAAVTIPPTFEMVQRPDRDIDDSSWIYRDAVWF